MTGLVSYAYAQVSKIHVPNMLMKHGGSGCCMDSWGRSVNISMFDPLVIGIKEGELTGNNTTRLYLCFICIAV